MPITAGRPAPVNSAPAATDAELAAAVEAHRADTTTVHGVTDTSKLAVRSDILSVARTLTGVTVTADADDPRPIDVVGSYIYGVETDGTLSRKVRDGAWSQVIAGASTTWASDYPVRIIGCDDGEVVVVTSTKVYKSSGWATNPATATWSAKVTRTGAAVFLAWGVDGDGTKFIASQYAGDPNWADSRYAHISTDEGDTWTQVWDSGSNSATHLHGVAYDPWRDRFYLSEGHDTTSGIYCSTDDGGTWSRADGMVLDPSPVVLVAHEHGLVCGSDNDPPGLYGVVTRADPADEVVAQTWRWRTGIAGVTGFAQRGFRDPDSDQVYVSFRVNFSTVDVIIAAGTPVAGAQVYSTDATGSSDAISNIVIQDGYLHGFGYWAGANNHLEAWIGPAGGSTLGDDTNVYGGVTSSESSVAVGAKATTLNGKSVAVGVSSTSNGTAKEEQVAVGYAATASEVQTVAVGASTTATGIASSAVGYSSDATGNYSTALGSNAQASADSCMAVGRGANADAQYATALGRLADAGHTSSVALGDSTTTDAVNQVMIGARHVCLSELSGDPSAAAANGARLYIKDNGSGKTGLYVRFASGAVQEVAIEP